MARWRSCIPLALAALAHGNEVHQIAIAEEGAIAPLLALMCDPHPAARENATRALWHARENVSFDGMSGTVRFDRHGAPDDLPRLPDHRECPVARRRPLAA